MSKRAFSKMAEGLEEALSIAKGEIEPARLVMPKEIDVKEIRSRADLSQEQFADIRRKTHTREEFTCKLDLQGNEFGDLSNSWPPRCDREIHVLVPQS